MLILLIPQSYCCAFHCCAFPLQQDHLIPLLVSIGCRRGRDIPEVSSQHPTRRRAVSSPHEAPGGSKLNSPDGACRRKSARRFEFGAGACSSSEEQEKKRAEAHLSDQMDTHINKRFEATQSVKPDEAFAMALQKQEIAKFK